MKIDRSVVSLSFVFFVPLFPSSARGGAKKTKIAEIVKGFSAGIVEQHIHRAAVSSVAPYCIRRTGDCFLICCYRRGGLVV